MIALYLLLSLAAHAHDEGHGPVSVATGKYGGIVATIIAKSDIPHEDDAKALGKAELVRSGDGTTRVYIYDVKMKKVDLKTLAPKGFATVTSGRKSKSSVTFALEQTKKSFIGKLPKVSPPYTLEVFLKNGETEIYAEFMNLD